MRSYPWDSVAVSIGEDGYPVYDRQYMASDLQKVQGRFFTDGIFTDEEGAFHVSPGDGMTVVVDEGWCCILGTFGYPGEEGGRRELALTASGTSDRIDTVVLRWDNNKEQRSIDLYVLTGAPGDVPVRPTLTRSETVWELGICDVFVPAHSLSVKAERITDTRLDSKRCGVCSPFVRLDTTNFFDQLKAQVDVAVDLANSALEGTIAGQLQESINAVDEKADGKVSKSGDSMSGALSLAVPLAVASGGTGGKTAADARKNILYVNPPITNTADDTPANWAALGSVVTRYGTAGNINGKPSTYGFLQSLSNGLSEVHQLWLEQASGSLHHRGGSASGFGAWAKVLDNQNTGGFVNLGARYISLNAGSLAVGGSKVVSAKTASAFDTKPDFVFFVVISSYRAGWYGVNNTINADNTVTVQTTLYNTSGSSGDVDLRGYVIGWKEVGSRR